MTAVRRDALRRGRPLIYGTVDRLDGFVGMLAEQHFPGNEFGELQLAGSDASSRPSSTVSSISTTRASRPSRRATVGYHTPEQVIEMNLNVTGLQDDVFRIGIRVGMTQNGTASKHL